MHDLDSPSYSTVFCISFPSLDQLLVYSIFLNFTSQAPFDMDSGRCKPLTYVRIIQFADGFVNRWEDDVKSDISRMKITNWKDCIRNRTKWKKLVEKAKISLNL